MLTYMPWITKSRVCLNFKILKFCQMRKKNYVFLEFFGFLILQQLIDIKNESIEVQLDQSHPPPVMRAVLYDTLLRRILISNKSATRKVIIDESLNAWKESS